MQTMNGTGPQRGTGLTALGVFLLSLGLMLFELSLTRVLSVLFYYHTAFLAISAAMLGSGGGALLVWFTSSAAERRISHAAQAAALTTLILPPLYGSVHLDPVQLENVGSVGFLWSLSLTMLICVLPFFFGGAALALVFRRHSRNVGRLYALDILGAAAAAPLLVPMMESYGGTGALIFAGLITAGAALCIDGVRPGAAITLLLIGTLLVVQVRERLFTVPVTIESEEEGARVLAHKWNAFSRVAAVEHEGWNRGLSEARWEVHQEMLPEQIDALIDVNAYAPMVRFDGDFGKVSYLKDLVDNLVYRLLPAGFDAAIIGPGGGKDVLGALSMGASKVTGIELNPILVDDFVRGRFKDFTGDIYNHPQVEILVGDGRSELERMDRRFDALVANSVATWAAHASGAMNLTESGLFTEEAFQLYADRLKDQGILSISLWDEAEHSLPLRLTSMWLSHEKGASESLYSRLAIVGNHWEEGRWFTTVLLGKNGFTEQQVDTLRAACTELGFDPLYLPGGTDLPLHSMIIDPRGHAERSRYDFSTPTDDRPFFFYNLRFPESFKIWKHEVRSDNAAWISLVASLGVVGLLVFALFVLPLAGLKRRAGVGILNRRERLFFGAVGAGFMLIEVSLIQRMALFLGHPTDALAIVLAGLLAWTGLGGLLSIRYLERPLGRHPLKHLLFFLAATLLILGVLVPGPSGMFAAAPRIERSMIALLFLAPIGLLLGIPMAGSLQQLGGRHAAAIPWAWGLNGAFGVLASVCGVIISIVSGFTATWYWGAACYVIAAAAWPVPRSLTEEQERSTIAARD